MHKRNLCFKALVGSHNYNLNTARSDKDYKIFFYPNFEDLYQGGQFSKAIVGVEEDVEYHDIRKLSSLLYKSNVNFMEVLFSEEYEVYDHELFEEIIILREDIARMNLPYLYDACMGMCQQKSKEFYRDSEKETLEKTCKHAMSAYRILDFLERYQDNSFRSFKKAIYYDFADITRGQLLDIRKGNYTFTQLQVMLADKETKVKQLENEYKSYEINNLLKSKIEQIIKDNVRKMILGPFS